MHLTEIDLPLQKEIHMGGAKEAQWLWQLFIDPVDRSLRTARG